MAHSSCREIPRALEAEMLRDRSPEPGMDLKRIEEAFDDASLDEFDIDPDAELFDVSLDDLGEIDV
jgi:hypothetical protein